MKTDALDQKHKCEGPVVFDGVYTAEIGQKKNNPGIRLKAKGVVHVCAACGWHYALQHEGIYADERGK